MQNTVIAIVFLPLIGAIVNGLLGAKLSRRVAHLIAIIGVGVACLLSFEALYSYLQHELDPINFNLYNWAVIGNVEFKIGFLVDPLSLIMCCVVTFVSLMVHIYTIGYMKDDPGYQRFFSYISLFTFAMLMLVLANNFLQLFFGWEAVGLVSYLLIGFWFKKDSAVFANLKAFLVNRIGDFGFLIGIAAIFYYFDTLDYRTVFTQLETFSAAQPMLSIGFGDWSAITFICICLFIGAMGKSAQVPLHVWLPDSMEGPTPISALIHAATMVTAGVFMVTRLSPLFELSDTALSFVMLIGAITALSMGLLGIVQNDIKRVIAYSTLSQLGYMVAALGVSAYAASIFHLMTHAFFKALLFLAAGSVIIAMHHIQDVRQMGGLRRHLPITWFTSLIGTLALIGFPFFSGFYSKDAIIESVHLSERWGSDFTYFCLIVGVFFTALYSMRLYYIVFHQQERMDEHTKAHLQESPKVIWVPLVALAIPSVMIAWWTMEPILFGSLLDSAITIKPENDVVALLSREFTSIWGFSLHGFLTLPFAMMLIGVVVASYCYLINPNVPSWLKLKFQSMHRILSHQYYVDAFNQNVIVRGVLTISRGLWSFGDKTLIDGVIINGSAKIVQFIARIMGRLQSGYLYHYALLMVVGVLAGIVWLNWPNNI